MSYYLDNQAAKPVDERDAETPLYIKKSELEGDTTPTGKPDE